MVVVIDYIQHTERAPTPKTVIHKIQAPHLVRTFGLEQLLLRPQAVITLPKANSRMLAGQGQKLVNNGLIILRLFLITISTSWERYCFTTLTNTYLMLGAHLGNHLPPTFRVYSFFRQHL